MLRVIICDDQPEQRIGLRTIVEKINEDLDHKLELALVTGNPNEVIGFARANVGMTALYFLDVDLAHAINGIDLAAAIRKFDTSCEIVFVTAYREMAYLTFKHKVNATDYIIKDNVRSLKQRMSDCIALAQERLHSEKTSDNRVYSVRSGGEIWNIHYDDIISFKTHPVKRHNIILHMFNGELEFRGSIRNLESLDSTFFKCSQSYVINLKHLKNFNKDFRTLELITGEVVSISTRRLKVMLGRIDKQHFENDYEDDILS